jgi:ATP-dependent DNA ligase
LHNGILSLFVTAVLNPPVENPPRIPEKIQWVQPRLVCEVACAEWTEDKQLRQTTFLGFHKILKSGCKAEESKLRTAERLVNLIALFWVVFAENVL